jgi:mevalonate kinase
MLLGEHAVLFGFPCLVASINRRVRVSVIPRNDGLVTITSALGDYEGDREDLPDHPSFRFALGALRHLPAALPGGLDIAIHADMPSTIGFGTSAAVTAAMIGALHVSSMGNLSLESILHDARSVIQHVQGRGSGADVAASIYGGVVQYKKSDRTARIIYQQPQPVTALYCGYKTPTPDVIARVADKWADRIDDVMALYKKIGDLVETGADALRIGQHVDLGIIMNQSHELMRELGVSTAELEECVVALRGVAGIYGAKISGSGLGDCAIGWGKANGACSRFDQFDIVVGQEGIRLE